MHTNICTWSIIATVHNFLSPFVLPAYTELKEEPFVSGRGWAAAAAYPFQISSEKPKGHHHTTGKD